MSDRGDAGSVGNVGDAVRWLGAPPTVVALVVLLLNDHVWKQQWPGAVTGKLSDVAGLLVAPPLLALVVALLRVPGRPTWWALGLTGVGFTVMKTSDAGARLAAEAWSLVTPSHVLADRTDLLALPVLALAGWTAGWAARRDPVDRRRVGLALGSLALPFAVVATSATGACNPHPSASGVITVSGGLAVGAGDDEEVVVLTGDGDRVLDTGRLVRLPATDADRVRTALADVDPAWRQQPRRQGCSRVQSTWCWRLVQRDERVLVEQTVDGTRWTLEDQSWSDDRDDVLDDLGERCGEDPRFAPVDVTVADTARGPVVAVALLEGGVALRGPSGTWARLGVDGSSDARHTPSADDPDGPLVVVGAPPNPRRPGTPTPTGSTPTPSPWPTSQLPRRSAEPSPAPTPSVAATGLRPA
ncbi:hypothetical protein [Oryzobacter terrae]|uniref:hypothetical protein n=1 Tax=Oryzobacter terrae TaxID=1620385 RepID=UPI00366E0C81